MGELNAYLAAFVSRSRRRSGKASGRIVDVLLEAGVGGRRLEDLEIASLRMTLVVGSTDTTPKVLGCAVDQLWRHSEQRARLARAPPNIPAAFIEALRFNMPTHYMGRTLRRDVALHGRHMRAGQAVLFLFASVNRDERVFEAPERFDSTRPNPRILGFGHGAHVCIGARITLLEGRILLEELLAAAPDFEVDLARSERRRADQIQGYLSLPLLL